MRRVQKTEDVVAVVERIIVGKVHSKSEGKDFTFPYDLRARLRAETDGQKETHFRARIRTFFSLLCRRLRFARRVILRTTNLMGKHGISLRKLGRDSAHRWAMLRTMADQLIQHERIETTVPKAKELRRVADKMITLGKEGTLSARRRAKAILRTDASLIKLFGPLAERYEGRSGGYTRVTQTRIRVGDAAKMAYIEYIDRVGELRPTRSSGKRNSGDDDDTNGKVASSLSATEEEEEDDAGEESEKKKE